MNWHLKIFPKVFLGGAIVIALLDMVIAVMDFKTGQYAAGVFYLAAAVCWGALATVCIHFMHQQDK